MGDIKEIIGIIDFIVWGYISLKIWEYITPQKEIKISEKYIEMFVIGLLIDKLSTIIVLHINWSKGLTSFLISVISPLIFKRILEIKFIKNRMIKTIAPLAWDFYFGKASPSIVKVFFKDSEREPVVGWFGENSFASSYPHAQDIYIEGIYTVKDNKLIGIKKNTKGILIRAEEILSIEFITKQT